MLIPLKFDLIKKKQNYKKDTSMAYKIRYVKIILALVIKIIALYLWAFIVEVWVFDLKKIIVGYNVYLK